MRNDADAFPVGAGVCEEYERYCPWVPGYLLPWKKDEEAQFANLHANGAYSLLSIQPYDVLGLKSLGLLDYIELDELTLAQ